MTWQASSSQSARPPLVPNGSPSIVCSFSAQPAPMPNSSLPPDRWSTVTAAFASTAGCRYVLPVTMHPILVREVATAIPASSVHASKIGPSSRAPRVAKWSMHQQWSNPASSATRQTPRNWSMVAFWLSLSP